VSPIIEWAIVIVIAVIIIGVIYMISVRVVSVMKRKGKKGDKF